MTQSDDDLPYQRPVGFARSYQRWGIDVIQSGYTMIPKALMEINLYLQEDQKLTPAEMMTLFVIISTWNNPGYFPSASKAFIAERLNITERQVQRIVARLVKKQVLRKLPGSSRTGFANEYWLTGILDGVRKICEFEKTGKLGDSEHQFAFSFDEHTTGDAPF